MALARLLTRLFLFA